MSIYSKSNLPNGFYVYLYLREDMTPYYVGKGQKHRAWTHQKRESIHPPKDVSRIIIIAHRLSEHEAFLLESTIIVFYGRKDMGTGILRNSTNGGQGPSGHKRSDETKQKMSESKTGIPSKLKGIKKSPEHTAKLAKSNASRKGKKNLAISLSKLGKPSPIIGLKYEQLTCPYCNSIGGKGAMKRWHFDNCKNNLLT